jgi:hypothetical protein
MINVDIFEWIAQYFVIASIYIIVHSFKRLDTGQARVEARGLISRVHWHPRAGGACAVDPCSTLVMSTRS